MRVVLWLNIVL